MYFYIIRPSGQSPYKSVDIRACWDFTFLLLARDIYIYICNVGPGVSRVASSQSLV